MELAAKNNNSTPTELEPIQIQLIMDQIESAVVLIHEEEDKILYGNSALLKSTAFTQEELSNLSWHKLIGSKEGKELPFAEPEACELLRRKREGIPVMVRAIRFGDRQTLYHCNYFPHYSVPGSSGMKNLNFWKKTWVSY